MALEIGALSAIILGLCEIAKKLGLPQKFTPLLAIILGILFSWLSGWGLVSEIVIGGIVAGLTAVGLYSGPKNLIEGIKIKVKGIKIKVKGK